MCFCDNEHAQILDPAMLNKSFVSISFSSQKKIQVLQLNSAKKRVKKFISVDLPDGLVEKMRVKDEVVLGKLLKDIWKKYSFKEKTVGLVIPESATFTKTLTLPKILNKDLDEAVRWQAYEFLPSKPAKLVLDWKVVKEDEENYQVLVVAIIKEILQGYVKAVSLAGLFPLVVETPSLSLERIADGKNAGRLVVYETFGKAILIVTQGEKIIGSSVADIADHEEVVRIAKRMLNHYGGAAVNKVYIGGPQMTEAIGGKLKAEIGKEVSWIKPIVGGLKAPQFQEYLIPISLQLKDPAEPSDVNTINLLPAELVKRYEKKRLQNKMWSLTLLVTLIVWICFFASLGVYLFLGQQIGTYKGVDLQKKISPEKAQAITQVGEINAVSKKVLAITQASLKPQTVLNAVFQAKPAEVSIASYRIDMDSGKISIIGISATRQALIDFKTTLEEYSDFSLVHVPITSLEKEVDLEYALDFAYLPSIGKKTNK